MVSNKESSKKTDLASNVILWLAFALISLGAGVLFLFRIHRNMGVDFGLGLASLIVRTGFYVSIGLLVESMLLRTGQGYLAESKSRRTVLHANWILVMFICVALLADGLVFAFVGYHLTTGIRILFSDGPAGVGQVIDATGLTFSGVVGAVLGVVAGLILAIVLSKKTRRISNRWAVHISRMAALHLVFISMGSLAIMESICLKLHNPFLWEKEVRAVPLAFSVMRPPAELASFRVSVSEPDLQKKRNIADEIEVEKLASRDHGGQAEPVMVKVGQMEKIENPDIFIVVLESLREDMVTPEIMPRFFKFAQQSWTFEHAQTTGNVTHFSWYGLFCAQFPMWFDSLKTTPKMQGSIPLSLIRRLGYRIQLLATPDIAYQNMESVVFGPGGNQLDERFRPSYKTVAERDLAVVEELGRRLAVKKPGGNVYIVALDSTHFGYEWGREFRPIFVPFIENVSIAEHYGVDTEARQKLLNRYQNSAAWVDSLLGRFFDSLQSSGRRESSIVVITGDHGEAFWEHGSGTHGSDLGQEQLEVGFAIHLPGEQPRHFQSVVSLLDVMPTVLYSLGVDAPQAMDGVAIQKRWNEKTRDLTSRNALTFQGWNSNAFRFVLTYEGKRVLLELDNENPLHAKTMVLKSVVDLNDVPLHDVETGAVAQTYQSLVRDIPIMLDSMPFIKW